MSLSKQHIATHSHRWHHFKISWKSIRKIKCHFAWSLDQKCIPLFHLKEPFERTTKFALKTAESGDGKPPSIHIAFFPHAKTFSFSVNTHSFHSKQINYGIWGLSFRLFVLLIDIHAICTSNGKIKISETFGTPRCLSVWASHKMKNRLASYKPFLLKGANFSKQLNDIANIE